MFLLKNIHVTFQKVGKAPVLFVRLTWVDSFLYRMLLRPYDVFWNGSKK